MSFDFSSLIWLVILFMALQPVLTGRWSGMQRARMIRAIEQAHGSRVITMIHRQERRSLFGFSVARHIDLEDAQTIIAAIKETPRDMPIDLVLHTPGGLVLAAANMMVLGIGMSASNPRHASNWNLLFALLGFFAYYNFINLSQAWVGTGRVGLGTVLVLGHGGAFVFALALLWWRENGMRRVWFVRRRRRRRAAAPARAA